MCSRGDYESVCGCGQTARSFAAPRARRCHVAGCLNKSFCHWVMGMMISLPQTRWARVGGAAACLAVGVFALLCLPYTRAIADDEVRSNRIRVDYVQPKSPKLEPLYHVGMHHRT